MKEFVVQILSGQCSSKFVQPHSSARKGCGGTETKNTNKKICVHVSVSAAGVELISLPTLLISIQTIPFIESSLIPLSEQIAIPRSIPIPELVPEPIPKLVPEPISELNPESISELVP